MSGSTAARRILLESGEWWFGSVRWDDDADLDACRPVPERAVPTGIAPAFDRRHDRQRVAEGSA
jgi:hypothetical protein